MLLSNMQLDICLWQNLLLYLQSFSAVLEKVLMFELIEYCEKISLWLELRLTCLIRQPGKKANCVCSTTNSRESFLLSFFGLSSVTFCVSIAEIVQELRLYSNSNFFIGRINAGNPEWERWAHLARSGSQSEHRIHFILPTGAASDVIMSNIVLDFV